MKAPIIHFNGKNTSIIISTSHLLPEVIYWGERIENNKSSEEIALALSRPVPQCYLDQDIPFSICPEHSAGYFGMPGLEGHFDDGGWTPKFEKESILQSETGAVFQYIDEQAGLRLDVFFNFDKETDVISFQSKVTNIRNYGIYRLQRLANTLPLPAHACELMQFHGRWCKEFQIERKEWCQGAITKENRRGRTSHESFPGVIVGSKGVSETSGEAYGFHLAWSGNHRLHMEVMSDGRRYCQAEELLLPGEVTLMPDESYTTPWMYATHSPVGLNGMSQNFHQYIRRSVVEWPDSDKPRPIHLNTWEGIYFDHDPGYMKEMATAAKELGVERFIIDDGWFPARNHDSAGLGDWFVDKEKYPQGLHPVADHVTGLGMELGLWFEPEMVNPDSQLCRKHPDWVLATGHYERLTERQQYVLNLQNPACFKYLFNCIDALLAEYPISYIKWDHNRVLVQASHNGLPGVHGQTRAVYRLIDQLRKAHPHVEIESCSSGGARIDMEVLKRTHRFWTSDTNDPVERQTIQQGFSYFFPPELMGAHVGTHASHTSGRRNSIAFRASTALFGHMGMELDPLCLSDEQKCEVKMFFDLHKSYRDLLHRGDLFRLDYPDDTSIAKVMVSKDKSTALVSMAQIQSRSYTLPVPLRLAGLDPDKTYRVQVVSNENDEYTMKKQPAWCEHGVELTGEVLMKVGLQLPVLWPESCLLVGIQQIRVE